MATYEYPDRPEFEGLSPDQLPDWYNKGYASQEDYLLKTTGNPQPAVVPIGTNDLEGLSSQQIMPQQQALLTPEQQAIVQNTDQQVAEQNSVRLTPTNITIGADPSLGQYFFTPPKQSTQPAQTTPTTTAQPTTTGQWEPITQQVNQLIKTPQFLADMNYNDRLAYLAQNPDLARNELLRAKNNAEYNASIGQDTSAQADYAADIRNLNIAGLESVSADKKLAEVLQQPNDLITDVTDEYRGEVDEETLTDIDTIGSSYTDAITTFESIIAEYEQSIGDLLGQISSVVNKPFDLSTSPQYQALQEWAKITGDIGSRQALEDLNRRGILNSTIAADRVAQIRAEVQSLVLPKMIEAAYNLRQGEIDNMMALYKTYSNQLNTYVSMEAQAFEQYLKAQKSEMDRQEKLIDRAWDRSESMGYVNNDDAIILGVQPGPTFAAQKFYEAEKSKITLAKQNNAAALERIKLTAAESMKRTKATADAAMARTKASNTAAMARTEASNKAAAERAAAQKTNLRPKAVSLAQQDYRWLGATTIQQKQSLVDEYMELVGGEPDAGGGDNITELIQDAVDLGATDQEIRDILLEGGFSPGDYGY